MKYLLAVLSAWLILPVSAGAEQDDDKPVTSTIEVKGGKIAKEKHEIEIYDYHSGTYNTVDVYRKPNAEAKPEAGKAAPSTASQPNPR